LFFRVFLAVSLLATQDAASHYEAGIALKKKAIWPVRKLSFAGRLS
jgi:hypothetical protein